MKIRADFIFVNAASISKREVEIFSFKHQITCY